MANVRSGYRVCDVMTRKPVSVSPNASVHQCAVLMQERGIGSLVVKSGDVLEGYITEQNIIREIVVRGLSQNNTKAKDIMTKRVATIHPNSDITDALKKMHELGVRQLPVIDAENKNKLVGLLTLNDILHVKAQISEILEEKFSMQEESGKSESGLEGTCDSCGEYVTLLFDKESDFLCGKCFKRGKIVKYQ